MSKKHILKSIPNFQKSYALLSGEERVERAVVFVHGYGGGPTTTWREFHSLVDEYRETFEWWSASDLFFYSYESRWTPIGVNAQRLALFLHEILNSSSLRETNPANFLPQTGQSLPSFTWGSSTYRDLLCVGHSEGAVLIRRIVLDRLNELKRGARQSAENATEEKTAEQLFQELSERDMALGSHLRFFAPACLGTNFSSWLGFLVSISGIFSALAASSLVRNELLPESPILKQIQTETEKAHDSFPHLRAFSAKILFGDSDQVVYTGGYNCDEIMYETNCDHFRICKPTSVYLRPLEFVSL